MESVSTARVSPEAYLEFERASRFRHEYRDGEIVDVTGATREHNLIVGNLIRLLGQALLDKPAEAYSNDMRVKVSATGKYVYPDVVVVDGQPLFEDDQLDTLLNPAVVVEVLSESTENYDRGEKFADYRSVKSVTDYLLVAQDKRRIEHFIRQPGDDWLYREYNDPQSAIEFPAVDCTLILQDVYRKVAFEQRPAE